MFEQGTLYTRDKIHELVGGSIQWYLPTVDGQVVCACLTPEANPDAPRIILAGEGEVIEQRRAVPTFIKRGPREWEYVGNFKAESCSRDPEEIAAQARRSGRNNISMVIHMTAAN
jgi:hypothetical protein